MLLKCCHENRVADTDALFSMMVIRLWVENLGWRRSPKQSWTDSLLCIRVWGERIPTGMRTDPELMMLHPESTLPPGGRVGNNGSSSFYEGILAAKMATSFETRFRTSIKHTRAQDLDILMLLKCCHENRVADTDALFSMMVIRLWVENLGWRRSPKRSWTDSLLCIRVWGERIPTGMRTDPELMMLHPESTLPPTVARMLPYWAIWGARSLTLWCAKPLGGVC